MIFGQSILVKTASAQLDGQHSFHISLSDTALGRPIFIRWYSGLCRTWRGQPAPARTGAPSQSCFPCPVPPTTPSTSESWPDECFSKSHISSVVCLSRFASGASAQQGSAIHAYGKPLLVKPLAVTRHAVTNHTQASSPKPVHAHPRPAMPFQGLGWFR